MAGPGKSSDPGNSTRTLLSNFQDRWTMSIKEFVQVAAMPQSKIDHQSASDEEWRQAERRESIVQPLVERPRLTQAEIADAMVALGLKRSGLYAVLARYRETPVTSTLLAHMPGPARGVRLLTPEIEAVIEAAIRDYSMTRQKPTVAGLRRHIAHECRARGLSTPSVKALRVRIDRQGRKALVKAREGPKAASDQFRLSAESTWRTTRFTLSKSTTRGSMSWWLTRCTDGRWGVPG
jgi:putative transposase